ncbi:hypothetical protein ACFQ1E_02115 [Sphingomonas canadensis]|uniref:Tetratricopeptide repeat protein n=1 Tax=Sphingomonas canadensis TaxID=1219257 RepID=A0ABW3H675_9SPHN|nr:hypothetical protein [Sphingomonas canadensis]MCW3834964.1 hypothetical protein [Sphingomonas canadensis]
MDDGRTLHARAQQARREGRAADALALQQEAADAFASAGDAGRQAHARRHLADLLADGGDPAAAAPLYAEVLAFYALSGPALDAANAYRAGACNAERMGDADAARRLWAEVRDRYAALGVNPGVAEAETRLAALTQG